MQKKYPDEVTAITLNVDYDEADGKPSQELQDEVLAKLVELDMQCVNVVASAAYEDVMAHYDLFSPPAALVYDQDGKLLRKFEGEFTYVEDVRPLVEEALASPE